MTKTKLEAVTLFHFVKAYNILKSINILCKTGYGRESLVLLRSLFNLCINIKWIHFQDTNARVQRFTDFEVINKKIHFDALNECGSQPFNEIDINKWPHFNEYKRIVDKYSLENRNDFYKWSGISIAKMAKQISMKKDYMIVYGYLSNFEHTNPSSVIGYMDHNESGNIVISNSPRINGIKLALLTVLQYYLAIKKTVFSTYHIESRQLKKEISQLNILDKKYDNLSIQKN